MITRWIEKSGETPETTAPGQLLQLTRMAVLFASDFASELEDEDEAVLRLWGWHIDFVLRALEKGCPPPGCDHAIIPDLKAIYEGLEGDCEREAERRGVTLTVWTPEQHEQLSAAKGAANA